MTHTEFGADGSAPEQEVSKEPESGDHSTALEREVSKEQTPHCIEEEGPHTNTSYGVDQIEDGGDTAQDVSGGKPTFPRFAQEFFLHAVADILGTNATSFERMKMFQDSAEKGSYTPFADLDEWELAQWLIKTVNQCATDEFLKLPIVSH